jgi:hypothetical protein
VPRWLRARRLATLAVECSGEVVAVTNRGPAPRLVFVPRVGVTKRVLPEQRYYQVEIHGQRDLSLAPGAADVVRFVVPQRLAEVCLSLEDLHQGDCGVVFSLEMSDPALPDAAAVPAIGSCKPDWSAPATKVRASLTPEMRR